MRTDQRHTTAAKSPSPPDGSNMPGGNKFAGGRRWPPVATGGRCRTVFVAVAH
jgi:hypothetical protein